MAQKTVTITLHKSELIYDIQNASHLVSRSRQTVDNMELAAQMQVGDEEEELSQILRSIASAFETLRGHISEYLAGGALVVNNTLMGAEGALTLELGLPENFNEAMNSTIAEAAHSFVVYRALMEWFVLTNKQEAQDYGLLAAEQLNALRLAMYKRIRPTRR